MHLSRWKIVLSLWLSSALPLVHSIPSHITPFLPQSFLFDWNKPGQALPVPTTEQCESIHIVWSRSTATGPNPTAPYYLQVYTSAYTLPFIISVGDTLTYDWAVPFAPGTLYQICMFDKFGNTGGCQDTYTVIPATSKPTCSNVTFPTQLDVSAGVNNGPMSQFGWVEQCTDISITPINGTPPYTLTVAPALHPPYNITSQDNKPINWTVSLSWASSFFISLVDSKGSVWSNGPLHSGNGDTTSCLTGTVNSSPRSVKVPVVIGTSVGGLVFGLLAGILAAYIFMKRQFKQKMESGRFVTLPTSPPGSPDRIIPDSGPRRSHYRSVPTSSSFSQSNPSSLLHRLGQDSSQYQIEPFVIPDEEGRIVNLDSPRIQVGGTSIRESVSQTSNHNVYVLHHDSQVPPVTIYHQNGTQIVELPPRYPPFPQHSEGSRDVQDLQAVTPSEPLILAPPRQPGQIRKSPRTWGR